MTQIFSTARSALLGLGALGLLAGLSLAAPPAPAMPDEGRARALAPPRPAACTDLRAPGPLQPLLDALPDGATACLSEGRWRGPLVLSRPVTIWGPPGAVVESVGAGDTVAVEAKGVRLLGFSVDGAGGRFDTMDAAIHVQADEVEVIGVSIYGAAFGVLVERSAQVRLEGLSIRGDPDTPMGLRGDGVRLWETTDSTVIGCHLEHSRDLVVWYSARNQILENWVSDSRYGTHLMYSHDNLIRGNRYERDTVGMFIMYSRGVQIEENLFALASGPGGMGLGLKESGDLSARRNLFVANTLGLFVDNSPIQLDEHNLYEDNAFRLSEVAITLHGTMQRNAFKGNDLRDNERQVHVEGGSDALGAEWSGNHFDDYTGYDLDGDGIGDIPYELRSLSGELTSAHPKLSFFRGTAALWLVDSIAHLLPIFRPKRLLVDEAPRLRARALEVIR